MNEEVFSVFPELASERLFYKNFADASPQKIFEIRSNKLVNKYLDREPEHNLDQVLSHINRVQQSFSDKTGINWVLFEKKSSQLAGYIGLWRFIKEHNRAEIGYVLHPDFWGQGLMHEAINTITRFAFSELQFHSIEANVNPGNFQSIKLLEKCCFKKEAYFRENFYFKGNYLDSVIYSLLEKDLNN